MPSMQSHDRQGRTKHAFTKPSPPIPNSTPYIQRFRTSLDKNTHASKGIEKRVVVEAVILSFEISSYVQVETEVRVGGR